MNLLRQNSRLGLMLLILFAAVTILFAVSTIKAHANPSFIAVSTGTSASPTLPQYMTVGLATTTETWNTQSQSTNALDSVVLLLGVRSSTTPSSAQFGTTTLSVRIEQSQDGTNWSLATSSTLQTGTCEQRGSSCVASTSVAMFTLTGIPTSMQYLRAIVGVQPGSSNNGAAWMQFIGKREAK